MTHKASAWSRNRPGPRHCPSRPSCPRPMDREMWCQRRPRHGIGCCYRRIGRDYLPWDAAHDVNAELQSLPVQPIGERPESGAICSRREARRHGDQKPVAVPKILFLFDGLARGVGHVPALVDDGIFPSELLQRGENGRIIPELLLVDGESVGVPTVPPQRRRGCERLRGAEVRDETRSRKSRERKQSKLGHEETYSTSRAGGRDSRKRNA